MRQCQQSGREWHHDEQYTTQALTDARYYSDADSLDARPSRARKRSLW